MDKLFAPPRTYTPPAFITDETGRELIPLTAAEARRLFNLHTRVTHPAAFHEHWSDWRRHRQAAPANRTTPAGQEAPGHV